MRFRSNRAPQDPRPGEAPPRPRGTRREVCVALGIVVVIGVLGGSMTVWGPCFDDGGELQLASAVLGIAHPPGYPGYIMLGRLICMIPFFEPAALISGANLLAGAVAMALCYLIQIRLGVHPLAALCTTAIVTLSDRYWMVITVPEVYAPSLCLLCLSAYGALRWAQGGSSAWVLLGAACCGLLVMNRPPAMLMVPALVLFVILTGRRRCTHRGELVRTLGTVFLAALVPVVICVGYLLWRENPDTPYNYVESFHQRSSPIVNDQGEPLQGVQRIYWLTTAQQYRGGITDSLHRLAIRLGYLRDEFGYRGPVGFCLGLGVVALGLIRLCRHNAAAAVLAVGLILGNATFYCAYISYGPETFILPTLVCTAWLGGHGLTRLFERVRFRPVWIAAILSGTGVCVYLSSDDDWLQGPNWLDAGSFLAQADAATLPPDSVILGRYHRVKPLQYEALVRLKRRDLRVLAAADHYFAAEVLKWAGHPIYFVDRHEVPPGYSLVPERNLFRVVRSSSDRDIRQPSR